MTAAAGHSALAAVQNGLDRTPDQFSLAIYQFGLLRFT